MRRSVFSLSRSAVLLTTAAAAVATLLFSARPVDGGGVLDNLYDLPAEAASAATAATPYEFLRFDSVAVLDMDAMILLARLASESPTGMDAASDLFEKGAYSEPFAVFALPAADNPVLYNTDVPPGSGVIGVSPTGGTVQGITRYGSPPGNTTLTVHYPPDGTVEDAMEDDEMDRVGGSVCRVGGNPTPVTDGCKCTMSNRQQRSAIISRLDCRFFRLPLLIIVVVD